MDSLQERLETLGMTQIFMGTLVLLLVLGIELRGALGDVRPTQPDIGLSTFELLPYKGAGYRFQIIPLHATPPPGFEQPGFDDTAFATSSAAFGSGGGCPLQPTVQTSWPINSQLLVRRVVPVPAGATNVRVMVSVDNDIVGVFFNGKPLVEHTLGTSSVTHDGCPITDEFRFDVPQDLIQPGGNLVAFHVLNRGEESFFDARILAEIADLPIPRITALPGLVTVSFTQNGETLTFNITRTAEPLSAVVSLAVNGGGPIATLTIFPGTQANDIIEDFTVRSPDPQIHGTRSIFGVCDPFNPAPRRFPDEFPPLPFPCPISCPTFPVPGGPCDPANPFREGFFVSFIAGEDFSLGRIANDDFRPLADFFGGVSGLLETTFEPQLESLRRFMLFSTVVFRRPVATSEFRAALEQSGLHGSPFNIERVCGVAEGACAVSAVVPSLQVGAPFTCSFFLGCELGLLIFGF